MNRASLVLSVAATAVLFGCSSSTADWNKATSVGTVAAYQDYMNKHPSDEHTADALDKIHTLQDEAAWSQAKQTNTADSYQAYVKSQPTGAHVKDAEQEIAAGQRATDWKSADSAGTVAAVQDFLKKYTDGSEVDQARKKLTDLTGYQVQLAAAKTERQAEQEMQKISAKYAKVMHDGVVVQKDSAKGYTVDSKPMSHDQAASACGELKTAHLGCEVVKASASNG